MGHTGLAGYVEEKIDEDKISDWNEETAFASGNVIDSDAFFCNPGKCKRGICLGN